MIIEIHPEGLRIAASFRKLWPMNQAIWKMLRSLPSPPYNQEYKLCCQYHCYKRQDKRRQHIDIAFNDFNVLRYFHEEFDKTGKKIDYELNNGADDFAESFKKINDVCHIAPLVYTTDQPADK